jgi:hypothetical protein
VDVRVDAALRHPTTSGFAGIGPRDLRHGAKLLPSDNPSARAIECPFGSGPASGEAESRDCGRGFFLQTGDGVGVTGEGDRHVGMGENVLDDLGMDPRSKPQGRERVSESVRSESGESRIPHVPANASATRSGSRPCWRIEVEPTGPAS